MAHPIERLRQRMPDNMEAVWIRDTDDRFYFTGMRSSAGTLLVTRRSAFLIIDFRYYEQAAAQAKGCQVVEEKDLFGQAERILKAEGVKRLSYCAGKTSVLGAREIARKIPGLAPDDSGELDRLIESIRGIKDAGEAAWHRDAQRMTDEVFAHICRFIRPGMTELDIAQEIGRALVERGSESRHFNFIVASGPNSSLPHGFATHRVVEAGDFIIMDFGAVVHGRLADMTRTVALGRASREQRAVYGTVLEAQRRAMDSIRPGVRCRDVDAMARSYIYGQGYEGCFSHGLGHAVGVQVHENPRFNETCDSLLEPGRVMTVEPGIYLSGRFGVRIEDMVWITPEGFENLTKSPKELLIL